MVGEELGRDFQVSSNDAVIYWRRNRVSRSHLQRSLFSSVAEYHDGCWLSIGFDDHAPVSELSMCRSDYRSDMAVVVHRGAFHTK